MDYDFYGNFVIDYLEALQSIVIAFVITEKSLFYRILYCVITVGIREESGTSRYPLVRDINKALVRHCKPWYEIVREVREQGFPLGTRVERYEMDNKADHVYCRYLYS